VVVIPRPLMASREIQVNEPTAAKRTIQAQCFDGDTGLPSTFDKTGAQPWMTIDAATSTTTTGAGVFVKVRNDLYQVALTQALVSVVDRHIQLQYSDADVTCVFPDVQVVGLWSGTAQGGSNGTSTTQATITLDASASATTDAYKLRSIEIISGTGAGQAPRQILGYNGSTKVATVSIKWTVVPNSTSVFVIR
jgi:hypothetical protein